MAHYNLIFQGKIIDGASLDEVKSNVARLFKADAAKTAALFSGKSIVIKKNLDSEAAKKYLAILKKAGAIITALKIEEPQNISQANTGNTASQTPQNGLNSGLASLVSHSRAKEPLTEDVIAKSSAKSSDINSSDNEALQLAPVGSYILGQNANQTAHMPNQAAALNEIPDTSHLTMSEAETGSLEEFAQVVEDVELPDIESLTMSEANIGSLEEFSTAVEPAILPDISDLNMAQQDNTPLSDKTCKPESADIPDTSALSMSEAQEGTLEGIEIKAKPVKIPDTSHIEIDKLDDKTAVKKSISGQAVFQID